MPSDHATVLEPKKKGKVRGLGLTSSSEEEVSGSSSWSMKDMAGAEAGAAMGWCGGDDGAETALPAMRASSLASFDEDGLELDDRCCTMSSPAADEPDIATDCDGTGSRALNLPEQGTKTARARHFSPHHSAPPHEPAGGGRIYLQTLAVRATGRRQTEADAAAGMLRAGGDRANRNCSPPPPLLPVD
jgi:hypothetical protein